jgi:3-oxoacyl-[acyl-carrier protein] reductase
VNVSRLSDKAALLTGAFTGIGHGIATALAASGARPVMNYSSDREGAEHVARAIIDSRGKAIAAGADISKAADVTQLFKEVDSACGRLDVLVNNAGAAWRGRPRSAGAVASPISHPWQCSWHQTNQPRWER